MDYIQTANKQVDKFGPGKHGFSSGNPGAGVLATFLSPDFCDDVMMEIINVILAGGVAPAAASRSQLLTALRSAGVFTTPAQFDASTKVATMEAVQRALGNYAGTAFFAGGGYNVISPTHCGKQILLSGSVAGSIELPPVGSVPEGGAFIIKCESAAAWDVTTPVAERNNIIADGGGVVASIRVPKDSFLIVIRNGSAWRTFGTAIGFGASLAGSGYQKLPSGIILQWLPFTLPALSSAGGGVSGGFTLPITFPTAILSAQLTMLNSGTASVPTGFNLYLGTMLASSVSVNLAYPANTPSGQPSGHIFAIGY